MSKLNLLIGIFIFQACIIHAQIVPNGGFEDYKDCPNIFNNYERPFRIPFVEDWVIPRNNINCIRFGISSCSPGCTKDIPGTPDYFLDINTFDCGGLNPSALGPHNGRGYLCLVLK